MSTPTPIGELLGPVMRELARGGPACIDRWEDQIRALRGCREPVRLTGTRLTLHARTGEVLHRYSADDEPQGQVMIRCGNRRASRCPACSKTYQADTYHLIRAGLSGGQKHVPEQVSTHPRVFATLTAPSFGSVHTQRRDSHGQPLPCRPRRAGGMCEHGRPVSCGVVHEDGDPVLGQPICPGCYDYPGAVLFNAHTGALWRRFTTYLWTETAKHAGIPARHIRDHLRLSYAKVAEFQRRGVVHFHAVIRADGPQGPTSPPPAWATAALLDAAIRSAAQAVRVSTPPCEAGAYELGWGAQVDVRPITTPDLGEDQQLTEQAVASYIAKYATKAAETTGTLDRRIGSLDQLEKREIPEHARRMIVTCWRLGHLPELAHLRLPRWAHMLGFRGHFTTKSRAYSTTLTAIRDQRRAHALAAHDHDDQEVGDDGEETTLMVAHWRYAGQGITPGESLLAALLTETGEDGEPPDPAFLAAQVAESQGGSR
ncbi:MAG: replication initiator [Carbonactinosporaceae bacterium]